MVLFKNVLVATDFGEASDLALRYGRALAREFGATLRVLHVTENVFTRGLGSDAYVAAFPQLQREIEQAALKRLDDLVSSEDRTALGAQTICLTSNAPAATIVAYAKDAAVDLIVLGTHGRGAVAHLLVGSVAERVVRTARCPVLTVRRPDHHVVPSDMPVSVPQV